MYMILLWVAFIAFMAERCNANMHRDLLTFEGDLVGLEHLPPDQPSRLQALRLCVAGSVLGLGYEVIHTLPFDLKGGESCKGIQRLPELDIVW